MMCSPLQASSRKLQGAMEKAQAGQRLDEADALELYFNAPLLVLGDLANLERIKRHNSGIVTYVGDRNINYSNICVCGCRFCAFYRSPQSADSYLISKEELAQKIEETIALGGTQILLQGGHHPSLNFSWYEDLLCYIRSHWPELHIHAFSPPEIFFWSKLYNMDIEEIILRLKKAGLDSIPGGGAEILTNECRKRVSPNKCSADEWLFVMETAHKLGMKTTATMMFGHEESPEERIRHLLTVREVQDRTAGFTAFIPWTFQPANTAIHVNTLPAPAYLRLLAISRLVLDNIDNIQASWVTMGSQIAQMALHFGANDFGSLMIEENVVAAAGVTNHMNRNEINDAIRAAGFEPRQRRMDYTLV